MSRGRGMNITSGVMGSSPSKGKILSQSSHTFKLVEYQLETKETIIKQVVRTCMA